MSKAYSFSLQKIYDYRKRVEEKKAVDLSRKLSSLKMRINEFDLLEGKKEKELVDQNMSIKNENLDLTNMKIGKDYMVQLNNELTLQAQKVDDANKKVNESRENLLEATKNKKMLEKLNARKYEEYRRGKKLEQSKKDDDIAGRIALYNKKKASGK